MADGRSEASEAARGSDGLVALGVRGAGAGRGGEGAGGRDGWDGEYNERGGKMKIGDDGDKLPASSLCISLSNLTNPGGSTPYLKVKFNKKICICTNKSTQEREHRDFHIKVLKLLEILQQLSLSFFFKVST